MDFNSRTKLQTFLTYFLPSLVVITVLSVFIGGGYSAWKYLSDLKLEPTKTANQTDVSPKKSQVQTPKKEVTAPQTDQTKPTNPQNETTSKPTTSKTTTPPKKETEYGQLVHPFTISDPDEVQATVTMSFEYPITDRDTFFLIHPDGRTINPSALLNVDRMNSTIAFNIYSTNPKVSPIQGDWELHIIALVGARIVIGVTHL